MAASLRPLSGAIFFVAGCSLLAGCGGGGGDGGGGGGEAAPVERSLQGVVAIGKPLAGAQVAVRCSSGTASTSADSTGNYKLDIARVTMPCMLRASGSGHDLVSVVEERPGGTVNANVTPLTHLLTARLLESDPVKAFEGCCNASQLQRLNRAAIDEAQEAVHAELATKLGLPIPPTRWVHDHFVADPDNPADRMLENLISQLKKVNKTLDQASAEIALIERGLLVAEPLPMLACVPGILSGFKSEVIDGLARVRARFAGGIGGGDSGTGGGSDGAGGAGAGGSYGQFRNVHVTVEFKDRTFGPVLVDAQDGMVTIVPCEYTGTALITFTGTNADAVYFDEAAGTERRFTGNELRALVNMGEVMCCTKSIGVTPFTDAAYHYVMRDMPGVDIAEKTMAGLHLKSVTVPWHDEARVQIANSRVRTIVNDQLPGSYRIEDITRRPVLLNAENFKSGSNAIGADEAGKYAAILAGFAKAGAAFRPGDPSPALTMSRQFSDDLSDGVLDMRKDGTPVASASEIAYTYDTLYLTQSIGTGTTGQQVGDALLKGLATPVSVFRVTYNRGGGYYMLLLGSNGILHVHYAGGIGFLSTRSFAQVSELWGTNALSGDRKTLLRFSHLHSRDLTNIPDPVPIRLVPDNSPLGTR